MTAYTSEDFQIDQFWLAAFSAQAEPQPTTVVDASGQRYFRDRFGSSAEYNYFYNESLIAYYHHQLRLAKRAECLVKRQLVYLRSLHSGTLIVEPASVMPRAQGRGVMVTRRPVSATQRQQLCTTLAEQLQEIQTTQAQEQAALAHQIDEMRCLLAQLYAQGIDPGDFVPLVAREPSV
ncbi:hypothetical protein [Levilactobacillus namurensis]|uniref:hypothetical protein n=1 Tax=Levilactobacillus namurensis TaxID=380393 RepID=UPI0026EC0AD3|nr:hypothetical protein [Levilactobacillus namurensis]